jgi:predicted TIM-barrel fold metal-dependent hydrolase
MVGYLLHGLQGALLHNGGDGALRFFDLQRDLSRLQAGACLLKIAPDLPYVLRKNADHTFNTNKRLNKDENVLKIKNITA